MKNAVTVLHLSSFLVRALSLYIYLIVILAGEVMSAAQEFLEDNMHPTKIINAYRRALDDIEEFLNGYARTIDPNDDAEMKKMVQSSLGTKFIR